MNGRRTLRLAWVVLCNGCLLVTAARALVRPEDTVSVVIGAIICTASATGILLELLKHRLALIVNVATPAFAALLMATLMVWLPVFSHANPADIRDAAEGAGLVRLFSLIPLCLAVITGCAYWVIDIEPDRNLTTLGLR